MKSLHTTLACYLLMGPFAHSAQASEKRCDAAPAELRIQTLGADYQCVRLGCSGGPTTGNLPPTPTPIPFRALCDGGLALQLIWGDKPLVPESFGSKERCLRAAEQFRSTKGCYCGADFQVRCVVEVAGTVKLQDMGMAFNRIEACVDALQQIVKPIEVKPR